MLVVQSSTTLFNTITTAAMYVKKVCSKISERPLALMTRKVMTSFSEIYVLPLNFTAIISSSDIYVFNKQWFCPINPRVWTYQVSVSASASMSGSIGKHCDAGKWGDHIMANLTIDQQWIMLALLLELMLLLMIHSLTYLIRQKVTLENGGWFDLQVSQQASL